MRKVFECAQRLGACVVAVATLAIPSASYADSISAPHSPQKVAAVEVLSARDGRETYRSQISGEYLAVSMRTDPRYSAVTQNGTDIWAQWDVHVWRDGTRQLRSAATGACLKRGRGVGEVPDMQPCDASASQSWYVQTWRDGTIRFQNQESGLCIRTNSRFSNVYEDYCDDS